MKIISLFSGGGGLDLGFEQAGFQTLACVENDPEACETLRTNRPHWNVCEVDIRSFIVESECDGVIGGPPCQGFSAAGKKNPSDDRNFLWREYARIVKKTNPRFVVLENVPALLHERNSAHLQGILDFLNDFGFDVTYDVLSAERFGVAQKRKRLFIVGTKGVRVQLPQYSTRRRLTAAMAIGDLRGRSDVANHEARKHAPEVVERWKKLGQGEKDPKFRRVKLRADEPSVTLCAGGGKGPAGDHLQGFHPPIHYCEPRQLTVREAARLQGFPDEWIFKGSKTAQGRQVGNAVPPPVASSIATAISRAFENAKEKKTGKLKPKQRAKASLTAA